MTAGNFWDDRDQAQKLLQRLNRLKAQVRGYEDLRDAYDDLRVLWELGVEEEDESIAGEVRRDLAALEKHLEKMELQVLLHEPHDQNNAIMSLHAGAGGTEAQDWVEMLLRMYTRWAENRNCTVEILDLLYGEEAGIKSATLLVSGENAYGYLKAERGVHRLVRISPFDASGRRHTSFASVDVLPEVEEEAEVPIDSADLKIDTYRSSGAGGQHVNKTDSAVRITHLPTGIVVQCQNERSQISNRQAAMKILYAKLSELKRKEQEQALAELRGDQQEIAWGSQIRSYVFHPYSLVKDHRTEVEIGNVQAVMNGDIDPFISAYLQKMAREGQG
jgi:peptide chain release factor 2